MAGNKILLDTNIISALLKGEVAVADKIDKATEVFVPVVVLGELYYGALYSNHVDENINNIGLIKDRYSVLNADEYTAQIYGTIKASLRKKGKPIPENDIWIAAIAKQYQLSLATRDKHFKEIEELLLISW